MVENKEVKEFKVPSHWVEVSKLTPELIKEFGRHAFNITNDARVYRSDYTHPDYQKWKAGKEAELDKKRAEKEAVRKERKESVDRRISEAFERGQRDGKLSAKREFEVQLETLKEEMRHQARMAKIRSKSTKKGSVGVDTSPTPASPTAPTSAPVTPAK